MSDVAAAPAEQAEAPRVSRVRRWLANPYGHARVLPMVTWGYLLWSLVPVLIAIQFSFNNSRSLTNWAGYTTKWYTSTSPNINSVFHDPGLRGALQQSMKLAALDVVIATPIGVMLALGLARWRGRGAGALKSAAFSNRPAPSGWPSAMNMRPN